MQARHFRTLRSEAANAFCPRAWGTSPLNSCAFCLAFTLHCFCTSRQSLYTTLTIERRVSEGSCHLLLGRLCVAATHPSSRKSDHDQETLTLSGGLRNRGLHIEQRPLDPWALLPKTGGFSRSCPRKVANNHKSPKNQLQTCDLGPFWTKACSLVPNCLLGAFLSHSVAFCDLKASSETPLYVAARRCTSLARGVQRAAAGVAARRCASLHVLSLPFLMSVQQQPSEFKHQDQISRNWACRTGFGAFLAVLVEHVSVWGLIGVFVCQHAILRPRTSRAEKPLPSQLLCLLATLQASHLKLLQSVDATKSHCVGQRSQRWLHAE